MNTEFTSLFLSLSGFTELPIWSDHIRSVSFTVINDCRICLVNLLKREKAMSSFREAGQVCLMYDL